ncbi:hypothetical protein [Leptospira santarosai]|uniref:hypothetical protein n=1 Tax=Leptospira santarosai TaxID=28183 RepID=UPI00069667CD|nr:hypothetical protein [Leptospira santarosai]
MLKIHICAICDKREVWGPSWAYKYILDGNRNSYDCTEIRFPTCSDECRQKESKLNKKKLVELGYKRLDAQLLLDKARSEEQHKNELKSFWHD